MLMQADSLLGYFIFYWPLILPPIFVLAYWRFLSTSRRLVMLSIGTLLGYGVQNALAFPLSLLIMAIIDIPSSRKDASLGGVETLIIVYGLSIGITALLLWALGHHLRLRPVEKAQDKSPPFHRNADAASTEAQNDSQEVIRKEFQPSVALAYKAIREMFHGSRTGKLFYGLALGAGILLLLLSFILYRLSGSSDVAGIPIWVVILGILLYVFALVPYFHYHAVAKAYRSNPSALVPWQCEVSKAGFRAHGAGFVGQLAWENIPEVRVSKTFVLFFVSKDHAHFIPKSLLSETEIAQIQEWKASSMGGGQSTSVS